MCSWFSCSTIFLTRNKHEAFCGHLELSKVEQLRVEFPSSAVETFSLSHSMDYWTGGGHRLQLTPARLWFAQFNRNIIRNIRASYWQKLFAVSVVLWCLFVSNWNCSVIMSDWQLRMKSFAWNFLFFCISFLFSEAFFVRRNQHLTIGMQT